MNREPAVLLHTFVVVEVMLPDSLLQVPWALSDQCLSSRTQNSRRFGNYNADPPEFVFDC